MGCDDLHKKRKKRNKQKGQLLHEQLRVLILTEGYSEQIYFSHIINTFRLISVEVEKSKFTDANSIIDEAQTLSEEALKKENEYDYIFCVFDLDTVKNKTYINAMKVYNSRSNDTKIFSIYSFPCIEVWFVLHFELHFAPFCKKGKKSVGDVVKSYLKDNYLPEYSETDGASIGKIASLYETAINNSEKLFQQQQACDAFNPICTVHKLLIFLKGMCNSSNSCQFEEI